MRMIHLDTLMLSILILSLGMAIILASIKVKLVILFAVGVVVFGAGLAVLPTSISRYDSAVQVTTEEIRLAPIPVPGSANPVYVIRRLDANANVVRYEYNEERSSSSHVSGRASLVWFKDVGSDKDVWIIDSARSAGPILEIAQLVPDCPKGWVICIPEPDAYTFDVPSSGVITQ